MPIPFSSRITGSRYCGTDGAVGADGLDIFLLQLFPRVLRAHAAHRGAFLGVGHFGDDGKIREGANRVDCGEQLIEIAESFDEEKIDAALFESTGLLLENRENLVMRQVANLANDAERSDGTRDEDFVLGGFARLARDFDAAMVELGDTVGHADLR